MGWLAVNLGFCLCGRLGVGPVVRCNCSCHCLAPHRSRTPNGKNKHTTTLRILSLEPTWPSSLAPLFKRSHDTTPVQVLCHNNCMLRFHGRHKQTNRCWHPQVTKRSRNKRLTFRAMTKSGYQHWKTERWIRFGQLTTAPSCFFGLGWDALRILRRNLSCGWRNSLFFGQTLQGKRASEPSDVIPRPHNMEATNFASDA